MNMFDIEQSIADWRRQMLAAGVKSPVPLDELESHLRDEFEQQMKSGMGETEAFTAAVQKIGPADKLYAEFQRQAIQSYNRKKATRAAIGSAMHFTGLALLGICEMHWHDAFFRICGVLVLIFSLLGLVASYFAWHRSSNFDKNEKYV
jgi:hypothetical protein